MDSFLETGVEEVPSFGHSVERSPELDGRHGTVLTGLSRSQDMKEQW